MQKNKAIAVSKNYFPNYPSVTELFVTKDEQVFFTINDATNHAKSIAEKGEEPTVVAVNVDDVETSEPANNDKALAAAIKEQEAKLKVLDAKKVLLEKATEPKKEAAQKAVDEAQKAYDDATKKVEDLQKQA